MIEFVDVIALKPVGGYRVWVRFSNGKEGIRDFSDMIEQGGEMVEPLADPEFFRRIYLNRTVPAWPNGFEIDSTNLHMEMENAGVLTASAAAE